METEFKNRKLAAICRSINRYVDENVVNKTDYINLLRELGIALSSRPTPVQLNHLCKTLNRIAMIDNRLAHQFEMGILAEIYTYLIRLIDEEVNNPDQPDELRAGADYGKTKKTIYAKFLKLALEIMDIENQKGKRPVLRAIAALRIYLPLTLNFTVSDCDAVFLKAVCGKEIEGQIIGLFGLEKYYSVTKQEVNEILIERLDEIFNKTNDRNAAYICLQMKIHAGKIDKSTAVIRLEDWNKKHH